LNLSNNKFSGTIPASLAAKVPNLKSLFLDGNDFTGSIPQELCDIPGIEPIKVDNNISCPAGCCQ